MQAQKNDQKKPFTTRGKNLTNLYKLGVGLASALLELMRVEFVMTGNQSDRVAKPMTGVGPRLRIGVRNDNKRRPLIWRVGRSDTCR